MEIQKAIALLCQALTDSYNQFSPQFEGRSQFEVEPGRKYLKIVAVLSGQRSVHAFVDKATGQMFKPASWKAPAKGARYNLLDDSSLNLCLSRADWAGSYLYAR